MGSRTRALGLTAALLTLATPTRAQVFRLEAGASSFDGSQGGSLFVHGGGYEAWFGFAALDPVRLGGALRTRLRGAEFTVGDDVVPLRLPTDVFDAGHALATRGAGVSLGRGGTRVRAIGGVTSTVYSAPFFSAARAEDPMGLLEVQSAVAPGLTLSARELLMRSPTHLAALEWQPRDDIRTAVTAGRGAGAPYAAASASFESFPVSIKGSYVYAGDGFHRALSPRPEGSEIDRDNLLVTFRPRRAVALTLGRNHYLQPPIGGQGALRGSVHQVMASGTVSGTTLNAAFFTSRTPISGGTGVLFGIGRDLTARLRADLGLQRSVPRRAPTTTTLVGRLRERLSQRIDLTQVVTTTEGNTSVSFGGSFLSNPITIGIEYQTVYLPFASGDPFRQALMLTLRLQPGGNFRANVSSLVGPDGNVRYMAYGDQYLYRAEEFSPHDVPLWSQIVRGRVQDESMAPVPGAALQIGKETVFTDSRGTFFVRHRRPSTLPFAVRLDESLGSEPFEVAEAPDSVKTASEDRSPEIVVTLRHVRSPRPAGTESAPVPSPASAEPSSPATPSANEAPSASPPAAAPVTEAPPATPQAPGSPSRETTDRLATVVVPETRAEAASLVLPDAVHFGFDQVGMSAATRTILDSLAGVLERAPEVRVRIDGHSDLTGGHRYNLQLSGRRARAVRDYLVRAGVPQNRLTTGAHGDTSPQVRGRDRRASAINRRVALGYEAPLGVTIEPRAEQGDLQIRRHGSRRPR